MVEKFERMGNAFWSFLVVVLDSMTPAHHFPTTKTKKKKTEKKKKKEKKNKKWKPTQPRPKYKTYQNF